MASEKTPNLGLNQIDRTSPKTTYFDLEKYLDQNWRAVDDFAGDVNDGVNEIKKRLDTTERKAVTLEPGVQIVHAEKASPFSLTGLKGRTLVNLLGRTGGMESLTGWSAVNNTAKLELNASNKLTGNNALEVTVSTTPVGIAGAYGLPLKFGEGAPYYLIRGYVKNGNLSGTDARAYIQLTDEIAYAVDMSTTDSNEFTFCYAVYDARKAAKAPIPYAVSRGSVGQYAYFDEMAVYELSSSEATAIKSMSPEQVAAEYPYVNSVMPVCNPYAIRYGENMLPSIYEAENSVTTGSKKITAPYVATLTKSTAGYSSYAWNLPAAASKAYTLSMKVSVSNIGGVIGAGGYYNIRALDAYGNYVGVPLDTGPYAVANGEHTLSQTFTTPVGTFGLCIIVGADTGVFGTFVFSEMMLNIGSIAKPFKSREDSMLALQTDLYADPVTGENADTVFEREGQYFKSKKWNAIVLDGNREYAFYTSVIGNKTVGSLNNGITPAIDGTGIFVKFNSKVIKESNYATAIGQSDSYNIGSSSSNGTYDNFQIGVSLTDSGWGDSYTPTSDEIKAYFNGWKMYLAGQGDVSKPFNNESAGKAWCPIDSIYVANGTPSATFFVTTLPTTGITSLTYTRYGIWTTQQLVYQLKTPTVEPIVSEGQLSFIEGGNQVEVGTGIILRERSKAVYTNGAYYINGRTDDPSILKNRVNKILAVYRDGKKDSSWIIATVSDQYQSTFGKEQVYTLTANFNLSSSYNTTYLMFDRSPVVKFIGTYTANEKTLLLDLVDSVQQNSTRLSVVENGRVENDITLKWIAPTLLNGWVNYDNTRRPVGYCKDSQGWVHVQGFIRGGATAFGTQIFTLPDGYEAERPMEVAALSAEGSVPYPSTIYVGESSIQCDNAVHNSYLILDFKYRAKQGE
ncbi:hypothetical protein BK143_05125 [Paenibacillus peoriae]|uniref:hypothetical protein n=1 Tax=Paenibacillus TaxID=44249 RepID=UPI0009700972|nr:hypothetical protein [Paenibacillus peoriae]OMF75745.1 hypothetical protein BK143_05125 [Paenibacillus peoriae]